MPPQARRELKEVGWTKGLELAKLARRDGQHFDCATWLHKARELPKEDYRREVEKGTDGEGNRAVGVDLLLKLNPLPLAIAAEMVTAVPRELIARSITGIWLL